MEQILGLFRAIGQMLRSRYVRGLEREVARLRAENRALLNSLLGTAGVPPLRIDEGHPTLVGICPEPAATGRNVGLASSAFAGQGPGKSGATRSGATPPLRRRSWQQIGRMLEIEEARREREHAAQIEQIREKLASDSAAQQKGSGKPNGSG
jgi:hypothetical protein